MARKMVLSPRREPQQARSRQMRDDILAAAVRVLQREGALRFTTPRVASAAGVSVGSLYQYFPNKQALLFALHQRAVDAAWAELQSIVERPGWTARQKVRQVARMFFVVESDEVAQMGPVLHDAEMYFSDHPQHRGMQAKVLAFIERFVRAHRPRASAETARFGAQLLVAVLECVGREVAARRLSRPEQLRWADACADMVVSYLGLGESVDARQPAARSRSERPRRRTTSGSP